MTSIRFMIVLNTVQFNLGFTIFTNGTEFTACKIDITCSSAHDKKIKKSDKTRHNSNFFDELNHAKSYQT